MWFTSSLRFNVIQKDVSCWVLPSSLILVFVSVLFSIVVTSLWEERSGLYASNVLFVYFVCVTFGLFSSSSCQ